MGLALGVNTEIQIYNITDRGGFYNLANISLDNIQIPDNYNAQNLDLGLHAYIGAVLSNELTMAGLNTSRTNSFPNKTYTATAQNGGFGLPFYLSKIVPFELDYFVQAGDVLSLDERVQAGIECAGFGGADPVNIDNVQVTCGVLLGPPLRTDGGDNNVYAPGSTWTQSLHVCASATRASIQTFTFSLSSFGNSSIPQLNVTREPTSHTVLWGMEKSEALISESLPIWGRIDEQLMNTSNNTSELWTVQSDYFMLPASSAAFNWTLLPEGSPQNAHATIWFWTYDPIGLTPLIESSLSDYTGRFDYSIKSKFQDLVLQNGQGGGAEMILNLIWTDITSNQLLGSMKNDTLEVAVNSRSLEYDFRFGIPGFILALIWLPVCLSAMHFLISRQVRWTYMKAYFNHLSIGRVVTGESALGVIGGLGSKPFTLDEKELDGYRRVKDDWAKTTGRTRVVLDLDRVGGPQPETIRLMQM
jgi:hypothetical protein